MINLCAGEAELLLAVLADLPDCDETIESNGDVSRVSCSIPQAKTTTTAPTPSSRAINASRERRKHEIVTLRRHATRLEAQLTQLQQRHDSHLITHSTTGNSTPLAAWAGVAQRQLQARRKTQLLNVKLHAMVSAQARVAQELVDLIRKADRLRKDGSALFVDPPEPRQGLIPQQQLLERLEQLCSDHVSPFAWYFSSSMQHSPSRGLSSRIVSHDDQEIVVDIWVNQIFPFAVASVENAIWCFFQAHCAQEEYMYTQNCQASQDTLMGSFTTASCKTGRQGVLQGTYASRRRRNQHGHFVLTSTVSAAPPAAVQVHTEPGEHQDAEVVGLFEDTWVRVLSACELKGSVSLVEETVPQPPPPLTVLQHVRRSRIRVVDDDKMELLQLHLALVEHELRWGQHAIESMLVRETAAESGAR